jgi:hypothetical protein
MIQAVSTGKILMNDQSIMCAAILAGLDFGAESVDHRSNRRNACGWENSEK